MNARMHPLRTASLDDGKLVHEVFERQAALRPNATAISFADRQIGYGELNRRSNQLAHALLHCGLQLNQPVAIMLEDGPQQVISLLGVIKAGGVIVCLDPEHPPARMRLVMEQTRPPIVISDNACLQRCRDAVKIPDSPLRGILLLEPDSIKFTQPDSDLEAASLPYMNALPGSNPGLSLDPYDPVYIVYTSGSTGQPKGIVQSHRSFCQFIEWQSNQFGIRAPQRLVQWASISYDAGYRQIFGSLCFGATLCMAPSSIRYNPQAFVSWLSAERVSILNVVPSFCSEIVKAIDANDPGDSAWPLPHLEQLLLTGEALSPGLARKWLALFPPPTKLFNLYGPSECILATYFAVENVTTDQVTVPIGKAIAGREILILDENQVPCPGEVTGEIYIRSDYLTLGYHGCQSETNSKFIQNPCHNEYPDPVYRTGDLGRWTLDGQVEFVGRKDSQVKLRGMRVELGEIEAVLQSVQEIDTCAVVVHTSAHKRKNLIAKDRDSRKNVDANGQQVLIAYFTATDDLCSADLRQIVAERLPSHMIPQQFIMLQEMPLNANRKLDRIALAKLDYSRVQIAKKYVAPRNPQELAITEIWSEVLGIEQIGVDDSFFELGGDSLLAMQVLNRIRRNLSTNLSFRDLLDCQNVGELAKRFDDKPRLAVPAVVETESVDDQADISLTLAQQGIWFLWRLEPDSPYYTGQGTLQLRGELDLALLQQVWSALLERHQILRVRFETKDGQPVQTFDDAPVTPLSCTDLTHVSVEKQWFEIEKVAAKKTEKSLNLERDRLFQGQLFKLSEDEHQLLLSFHEIVLDLWGLSILVRDLTSLYHQSVAGGLPSLPPASMTFRDYARWEQQNIRRDTLQQQEAYWREQLDGELPVLQLPTDRPRPTLPSYKGASKSIVLSAEESRNIRQLSSNHDATLFMTLLGAFNILLRAYSGQDDIVIGAPIANRTNEGVEDLAGFFLNMLPLRTRIDDDPRFTDLLGSVRETVTGAICNAEYPFMWMLEAADVKRDLSVTPVFQVMFNMLNLPQASSHAGDLEITYNEIDTPYIKYDLCLYAQEHDDQIYLELSYLTDLFDETTIDRLLENYRVLLNSLVADPELPVSKLTLLSETERETLVNASNETHRDYQNDLCIHQLFERQVDKTPDSIAFMCKHWGCSADRVWQFAWSVGWK
jgi:amino acid adenylation domain-containing protein